MSSDDSDKPDFTIGELPEGVKRALEASMEGFTGMHPHEELGVFITTAVEGMEKAGMTHSDAMYAAMALMTGNPGPAPKL